MGQNIFDKFIYGGDYNPEQWLDCPDILARDIELMKKASINTVTLGVFSWAALEPQEGIFQLDWLAEIIDRLYQNGIRTILATPSGSRPRWLAERYPEVLRVREDRRRYLYGERHNHCYTSPVYREKVRIINQKLAERFRNHPAVILWHISNEYRDECHCPLCQEAFRKWLEKRYHTIDNLNHAWWTAFWSHTYDSFQQVESPSSLGDSGLHGLSLDWKRFVTVQTADFMYQEIQALRDAGAHQPTVINFMEDYIGLNYWELARHVDYVSLDSYPRWHYENDIQTAYEAGMQHDLMRSMKQKPFLLMESSPSSLNWQKVSKLKKPGFLLTAALHAIAHGSNSAQFFQIRQGRGGFEKFHGAVIDHYGGEDTRVFREAAEAGAVLESLSELTESRVEASAAVLCDVESRWAMENSKGPRNEGLFYHEAVLKSYQALRKSGLNVDVIDAEQSLENYQIVAAPMLYMFRAGIEEKLRRFVETGGILVMTYWSGIVNETDLCCLGGTPHGLMDVLGLRSEEIDGLCQGESNDFLPLKNDSLRLKDCYHCFHLCDLVQLKGADALMIYGKDFYKGHPALTVHPYGKGFAYYVCADAEADFYDDLYRSITVQQGIPSILETIPEGVEVSSRKSKTYEYVFVQNFTNTAVKIALPEKAEILFGNAEETIQPYSTVILRRRL